MNEKLSTRFSKREIRNATYSSIFVISIIDDYSQSLDVKLFEKFVQIRMKA